MVYTDRPKPNSIHNTNTDSNPRPYLNPNPTNFNHTSKMTKLTRPPFE